MKIRNLLIALLLVPTATLANDGYGGLTATGLQFSKSTTVRMVAEDLFLSAKQVRVQYVFHNDSKENAQGEVIFPLPPISLADLQVTGFSIPEEKLNRENAIQFIAMVNGKKIAVRTERQAILEPPWDEQRAASIRYDAPGRDVTALLKEYGLPLSFNHNEIATKVARLPQKAKDRLKDEGLVNFFEGEPPMLQLSIIERYHWSQTFPAGQDLRIEHRYNPAPPGGILSWPEKQTEMETYNRELITTYCIDGIHKTGLTTFEVEKKNFRPAQDLRLLIVSGLEEQP